MAIYHVLADGSRPTDITGHVVRLSDAESFYQVLHSIKKPKDENSSNTYDSKKEVRVC